MDTLTLTILAVAAALSIAAWSTIARRLSSGQPLIPFAQRRSVPWRFGDLLIVAAFYLLSQFALIQVFAFVVRLAGYGDINVWEPPVDDANAAQLAIVSAANIATNLATVVFTLLWLFAHRNVTWADLGWKPDTVAGDVRLGLVTFAAIAPPIYGLQAFLSQFVEEQHPIIEVLSRERTPLVLALAGLSAVVVAPLAEEFFFRVLLQGWLESARIPTVDVEAESEEPIDPAPRGTAIVATALVFALLHLGHGAAPIPLFFFALALGYLYQRTHRLLPSVTVHFCLNAFSFVVLCSSSVEQA